MAISSAATHHSVTADNTATHIPCENPATGEFLGQVTITSPEQVRSVVDRARLAYQLWRKTSFSERRRVLRALQEAIIAQMDHICDVIVKDSGKTRENALLGEVWPVCEKLRWTMAHGSKYLKNEVVSSGLLLHKKAQIEYHPLGVIGVISPWNFPLQNILGPTIPALMAGNAVVVKVSEWTAWSSDYVQNMLSSVLTDCGYPQNLVQVIQGYGETGAALVSSGVEKVIFTGSVTNGRKVVAESAATLTPVTLELGGKDPLIVCDDANIEKAVHATLAGTMISSGQMCLAAERVIVFDEIYDRFKSQLVAQVKALRQAPPCEGGSTDVGALTMPAQADIIANLISDAVAQGASILVGGSAKRQHGGTFFEPTVIENVQAQMKIFNEETFGPVISLIRVRDEDEAVHLANATPFGLGSSIFSANQARAKRIARRIEAGSSCINDFGLAYMAQELPFGGIKASGFGRLNGRDGLRACCNTKAVLADRIPLNTATRLYPVKPKDFSRAHAIVRALYSRSPTKRLRALLDAIRS